MQYDKETTDKLVSMYNGGSSAEEIAEALNLSTRSVIGKLSSLGIYKKKQYLNKLGQPPVKKEEYVARIADLLEAPLDTLDSLEKANKRVLQMIEEALQELQALKSEDWWRNAKSPIAVIAMGLLFCANDPKL